VEGCDDEGIIRFVERPRRHLIQVVGRACDILSLLHSSDQPLKLAEICARLGLAPPTAFRVIDTLCAKGLVERPGHSGYRTVGLAPRENHFRLGYAAQSSEFAFSRTTAHSMEEAAKAARIELLMVNNRFSRTVALKNADHFVRQKVDLVVEFQTFVEIAPILASKYHDAGIPMIAVEIPHPGRDLPWRRQLPRRADRRQLSGLVGETTLGRPRR
jgi:ribose transport system substrate-binding protein